MYVVEPIMEVMMGYLPQCLTWTACRGYCVCRPWSSCHPGPLWQPSQPPRTGTGRSRCDPPPGPPGTPSRAPASRPSRSCRGWLRTRGCCRGCTHSDLRTRDPRAAWRGQCEVTCCQEDDVSVRKSLTWVTRGCVVRTQLSPAGSRTDRWCTSCWRRAPTPRPRTPGVRPGDTGTSSLSSLIKVAAVHWILKLIRCHKRTRTLLTAETEDEWDWWCHPPVISGDIPRPGPWY